MTGQLSIRVEVLKETELEKELFQLAKEMSFIPVSITIGPFQIETKECFVDFVGPMSIEKGNYSVFKVISQ